mmetsp:Transcript_22086/g.32062  ORF Transcript_22086/g.32062 Transcript_22086/m.32062 type:complete len:365 (-) Transcript_22086:204-1298(-)
MTFEKPAGSLRMGSVAMYFAAATFFCTCMMGKSFHAGHLLSGGYGLNKYSDILRNDRHILYRDLFDTDAEEEEGNKAEGGGSEPAAATETDWSMLRSMLNKQMEKDGMAVPKPEVEEETVELASVPFPEQIEEGTVLVASPRFFYEGPELERTVLRQFALNEPIPEDIPIDRQADLLPVVLIASASPQGVTGFVLNRRTGYLMGDLADINAKVEDNEAENEGDETSVKKETDYGVFGPFMIQPIWLGGVFGAGGLGMVHSYEDIEGAKELPAAPGLYYGGDFKSASKKVSKGTGSSFNFRFFLQFTQWGPGELEMQMKEGMWTAAKCSKMVILKARDRTGPNKTKPMWTDMSQKLDLPHVEKYQ